LSYCGLNNVKHKPIIDEIVEKGVITRFEEQWGYKKNNKVQGFRERQSNFSRNFGAG